MCVSLRNTITSTVISTPRSTRVWNHHRLWEYSQFSHFFRRITFLLLTKILSSSLSHQLINFSAHAQHGKFFHMGCVALLQFQYETFFGYLTRATLHSHFMLCAIFKTGVSWCWIFEGGASFWLCLWFNSTADC